MNPRHGRHKSIAFLSRQSARNCRLKEKITPSLWNIREKNIWILLVKIDLLRSIHLVKSKKIPNNVRTTNQCVSRCPLIRLFVFGCGLVLGFFFWGGGLFFCWSLGFVPAFFPAQMPTRCGVLWWCGVIVVVWCYCGGVFVVFLWWCGGVLWWCFVVVFLWWCFCAGVFVLVFLCWCFCAGVFVLVFVWWCLCGGVFVVVFLWCGWVVFLWWCFCGGVCVVMFLWWCGWVVFLWWCLCGGVSFQNSQLKDLRLRSQNFVPKDWRLRSYLRIWAVSGPKSLSMKHWDVNFKSLSM